MTKMPPAHGAELGDVVLVLFPDSDLRTAKRRPALVVQAGGPEAGLPQLIVAMITSRVFRSGLDPHPHRCVAPNEAVERTTGSHSLAVAAHRQRQTSPARTLVNRAASGLASGVLLW